MKRTKTIMALIFSSLLLPHFTQLQAGISDFFWARPNNNAQINPSSNVTNPREMDTQANNSEVYLEKLKDQMLATPDILIHQFHLFVIGLICIACKRPIAKLYQLIAPSFLQNVFSAPNPQSARSDSIRTFCTKNNPRSIIEREEIEGDVTLPEEMMRNIERASMGLAHRNIILYGPSQVGKSTYAKFYAKKLEEVLHKDVLVYEINPGNLLDRHVGQTEDWINNALQSAEQETKPSFLRKIYNTAKNNTVAKIWEKQQAKEKAVVIIVDELNALFIGQEGEQKFGLSTAAAFQNGISNIVNPNDNLIVIGTTNHLHEIPEPVRRRSICIYIEEPNQQRRKDILHSIIKKNFKRIHKRDLEETEQYAQILEELADRTEGLNITSMANACEESFFLARQKNQALPSLDDFGIALEKTTKRMKQETQLKGKRTNKVDKLPVIQLEKPITKTNKRKSKDTHKIAYKKFIRELNKKTTGKTIKKKNIVSREI